MRFAPDAKKKRGRPAHWRSSRAASRKSDTPDLAAEFTAPWSGAINRRSLMKLMGASLALGATACSPPPEEIVPYVDMPEGLVPGEPLGFATALPLLGLAAPALALSRQGRPTKLDGNPDHPWSRGASDAFTQAAVLSLYDPDRAQAPTRRGEIRSWDGFMAELTRARETASADGGAGIRVLSGAVTSPTLAAQMRQFLERFPRAVWHRWQPLNRDHARAATERAFGRPLDALYRFDRARIVLTLDADPFGPGPSQVRHAGDFATVRRARGDSQWLARLYAAEPTLSLTGAQADRRLAVASHRVGALAAALAARLSGEQPNVALDADVEAFIDDAAEELVRNSGAALVVVGESQPPEIQALGHWINGQLGAIGRTVQFIEPVEADPVDHTASIARLTSDMAADEVEVLLILGGNPVYDAPADLPFAPALAKVPLTAHLGLHDDETSAHCLWHLPEDHPLETWSDARAPDGRISIVQPLITRLFDTRSVHEAVALLLGDMASSGHALVRTTWRRARGEDFDEWWRLILRDGMVAGSAAKPVLNPRPERPGITVGSPARGFELSLRPDPAVWDGRFANNAWLQELPRPISKITWGNALNMAASDAERLGIRSGDMVRVAAGHRGVEVPALIAPGQAQGTLSLTLGYGRSRAGAIGTGVGVDAYPLRMARRLWTLTEVAVSKTGRHKPLADTQEHHEMHGRDIVRKYDLAELAELSRRDAPPPTLYPEYEYDTYAWSMVIDQSVCIGCNACVAACQAENNVPVVGPEEVRRGRDMHWLRVDSYLRGPDETPEVLFQPVACMHCEKAPCEPVCPVEASVHDGEGLNVQVYNRCIGTRFCQSNCPYKVRRFNFYGYANGQEYANLGAPVYDAVSNPDVTVRARGVMEKCTYCVQRISRARRQAKKENRRIREGEVVTACQAACPTQAIQFGDLNREDSAPSLLRREPHAHGLLEHLGTRPRTTYLAVVRDSHVAGKARS